MFKIIEQKVVGQKAICQKRDVIAIVDSPMPIWLNNVGITSARRKPVRKVIRIF